MINQYVAEKLMFAYYYRKPPVYGTELNDGALRILAWAPFLMIGFGYW
jgi:hypothetical protein